MEDLIFSKLPYQIALGILIAKHTPNIFTFIKNNYTKHKAKYIKVFKIFFILFVLFNLFAFIEGIRCGINQHIKNEELEKEYNNCLKKEPTKHCSEETDFCFIEVCEKPFLPRVNYFEPLQDIYNIR